MIIVGIAVTGAVILAIVAMAFNYMKQMERLKRQPMDNEAAVTEAITALRKELADLRDSSTNYDVSFDTALQRIEGRISSVEQRTTKIEQEQPVSAGRS